MSKTGRLTARGYEERVRQLDEGESSHIPQVYDVREDPHEGQEEWEAIDDAQENL